jgi:predicted Zn-dependent protease
VPRGKLPAVRAARWTAAVLVLGTAAWLTFSRRPAPVWRLVADATAAIHDRRFDDAFRAARAVTEDAPSDPRGWMLLAVSLKGLGMPEESAVDAARRAAALAPGMYEARQFLAVRALAAGRVDEALAHATAAASDAGADARAFLLLARVELARPRPDLARARDAVERARRAGRIDADTNVLLAELCLRTSGVVVNGASQLPAGMEQMLHDAVGPAASPSGAGTEPGLADARSRIKLALGDVNGALAEAERALADLGPSADERQRAALEADRAMALHAAGDAVAAAKEFASALARSPDVETASLVASFFEQSGDAAAGETVLAGAKRSGDPHGAIRAVLAQMQLDDGRVADAAQSIAAARSVDPGNAGFAAVEAAVRAAEGRWDDARVSLADASKLAPQVLGARIDLAVLDAERPATPEARAEALRAARAALEALRRETNDDAAVLRALGRIEREMGATDAAAAVLRRATQAAPWDAEAWRELGETLLVARPVRTADDAADDSAREAADVFARAAALRPQDPSLRLREAEARLASGDAAGAVAALDESLRFVRRSRDEALRRRAAANVQLGAWRSAAADLERLRETSPRDATVVIRLVDALFRAGDDQAARRIVAESAATQRDDVRRVLEFIESMQGGAASAAYDRLAGSEPSRLVAEIQLSAGRVDDAIASLRALVAADPRDAGSVRLLVLALLDGDRPTPERLQEATALADGLAPDSPPGLADFVRGRILLAQGDAAGASVRLEAAETAAPSDPYAALLRGEALFRSGDRGVSVRCMRRALALPGTPPSFRPIVAMRVLAASRDTSDPARAFRLAEEAFRLAPEIPAVGVRYGEMLSARTDFAGAARVLESTLVSNDLTSDQRVSIRFTAAMQRYLAGDARRAQSLLEGLPRDALASAPSRLLAGCVALRDRRLDDADAAFAEALRLDPASAAAASGRVEVALARGCADEARRRVEAFAPDGIARSWFLARVARAFLREGFADDARALARRAAETSHGDPAVLADTAAVLARTGDAAAAADELLARAQDAQPADAERLRLLAGRLVARIPGRAAEARDLARRLRDSETASAAGRREASLLEAEALLCAGDAAGAAKAARALVDASAETTPSTAREREFEARLAHTLGTALSSAADGEAEATRLLSRAVELDPDDEVSQNNLAYLLSRSPATATRGLEFARRATAADPANANYWDTRAACAAAASEDEDAETSWRKALALNAAASAPDRSFAAQVSLGLGRLLTSRGRAADARAPLESVLRDAPSTPAAEEAKRLLAQ